MTDQMTPVEYIAALRGSEQDLSIQIRDAVIELNYIYKGIHKLEDKRDELICYIADKTSTREEQRANISNFEIELQRQQEVTQ